MLGLPGTGEIGIYEHESEACDAAFYKAWRDVPDEAMTRKEHEKWLKEQEEMRQPVNRWNRGGKRQD
jgi:hypothetical protein